MHINRCVHIRFSSNSKPLTQYITVHPSGWCHSTLLQQHISLTEQYNIKTVQTLIMTLTTTCNSIRNSADTFWLYSLSISLPIPKQFKQKYSNITPPIVHTNVLSVPRDYSRISQTQKLPQQKPKHCQFDTFFFSIYLMYNRVQCKIL